MAVASRAVGKRLAGVLLQFILAFAVAIVVVLFIYEPVRVEGNSMQPQLSDNERLFINKFIFSMEPIERGDVVVFHYPLDPNQNFIKRVIGLPGDLIQIVAGRVYVNGRRLLEPYIPADFSGDGNYPPSVVPPDEYFVLGDHRDSSNDSRNWGFLDRQSIFGKAVFAYWPPERIGLVR